MFIIFKPKHPQWWLRLKIAYRCAVGAWKHTDGVHLTVGDTLNVHHKFHIVGKHYG